MTTLPFPVRFAVLTDLALNAGCAAMGQRDVLLGANQIGQFGILVAAGIVVHEINGAVSRAATQLHRWWHRRKRDRQ